ncbi:MAG: hypothetical protein NXI04_12250 [Planctomycetaceae bacterium]|nr:hypothetical protein [Planctomycetaceae bacterium]
MSVFPFAQPPTVSFYLIVYVLTLVLHAIFMTYVLAGSLYLAWAAVFRGSEETPRARSAVAKILREWMPFALSAAITAGVAPLLFVQIIYRQEFYTSNLLLGWRWLMVVPVLVVGFYLLYVVKSRLISNWPLPVRIALVTVISACFLFVAFCWTTNHLLGIQSARWPQVYESGQVVASLGALTIRLAMWVAGAFPCMSIFVAWQLRYYSDRDGRPASQVGGLRALSMVASVGILLTLACAGGYLATLTADTRSALLGSQGGPWMMAVALGSVVQLNGWWLMRKNGQLSTSSLSLVTGGCLLMLTGAGFLRELLRFVQVDASGVARNAKSAASVGGFWLFVLFTVVNVGLMAICVRLVRPALRTDAETSDQQTESPTV